MNANAGSTQDAKPAPMGAQDSISATIDAPPFKAAVEALWKHAPDVRRRWSGVPILNCFTIKVADGEMRLSHHAIDMDVTAHLTAAGAGHVVVPATSLLAFVSAADGAEVALRKEVGEARLVLSCGSAKASVVPMAVGDLPMCFDKLAEPARSFELAEGVFRWLTALPSLCWSTDDSRYYLNGLLFEVGEKEVHVVATNGHMLGCRKAGVGHALTAWEAKPIVPREVAGTARGAIAGKECRVEFFSHSGERPKFEYNEVTRKRDEVGKETFEDPRFVRFTSAGWTVTAKLIDGTYPDWRRVVPESRTGTILELNAGAMKRASTLAGKAGKSYWSGTHAARISRHESGAAIAIKNPDIGDFSITAPGTSSDEFEDIGINIHCLAKLASAFATPAVTLAFADRAAPIRIEPPDNLTGEFAILMPMRV